MPDKPVWFSRLDAAIDLLERLPHPWVDRAALEFALDVGRRRAQQILRPLVSQVIGRSGLAPRDQVIAHLRRLAAGRDAGFERERRDRLASALDRLHHELTTQPRVLVEAPTAVLDQELDDLPSGVHLAPGRIVIEGFASPAEAQEKLLALILAMGNDPDGFERRIAPAGVRPATQLL